MSGGFITAGWLSCPSFFFFKGSGAPRVLPFFPPRPSSDLADTVSGGSAGRGNGSGGVPGRAAGGGLAQLAGPAATTLPAGDRLVQSGTPAVHDTSAGAGLQIGRAHG